MADVCVIGCGHMGSALVRGLVKAGYDDILACDVDPAALESVADLAVDTTTDSTRATEADIVVLAVKPHLVGTVLDGVELRDEQTVVTIAAGVPTTFVKERTDANVVRLMPNLAAEWQEMAGAITGDDIPPEVHSLFESIGSVVEVEEDLMDTATAINGSGPAFVFYLIQAMRDAGIERGFDEEDARVLAAQTFKGAAETIIQSDDAIEDLIDAVCSPQGTTIEGMETLRDRNVDADLRAAVIAAEERAIELAEEAAR